MAICSRAIRRELPNYRRRAPMSSMRSLKRKKSGSPPARRWKRRDGVAHRFSGGGFRLHRFFLFRRHFGGLRLLRRTVDDAQPAAIERVDAGPWSAEVGDHDLALASLVGTDRHVVWRATALNGLAFSHAKCDVSRHPLSATGF